MPSVPEDIIPNILSRLPVKSLIRLRCVSKPWRTLISDPNFAKLHLKRTSEHYHHTILTSWSSDFRSINFNASSSSSSSSESHHNNNSNNNDDLRLEFPITCPNRYRVWDSCNGLIFLLLDSLNQMIWNPSTRDYKVLSKPKPQRLYAFVGFGFDALIDDYKVVMGYFNVGPTDSITVEVFTLKTNTWRSVQVICNPHVLSQEGYFVNGALHWHQERETIMSFDLAQEQFGELGPLPHSAEKRSYSANELGILQGCLCLCRPVDDKNDEVWVMKEYGLSSSWSKLFNVSFETGIDYMHYFTPLFVLKDGDVIMELDGRHLVRYSPKDKTFRHIHHGHVNSEWFKPVVYVESLVSLN